MSHPTARPILAALCAAAVTTAAPGPAAADGPRVTEQRAACPSGRTVTILAGQDGATVPAGLGDTVVVRLPVRSGTGYAWSLRPHGNAALAAGGVVAADGAARPGGAAVEVFRLRAAAPGRQTLVFDYRRPWEQDRPAARSFTVTVDVSGC